MRNKMNVGLSILPLLLSLLLSACGDPKSASPEDVASQFWDAVKVKDMESAKDLSTWETVVFLEFLNKDKFNPERFELGEAMVGDTNAQIETILYTSKLGEEGVKLPGVTVLIKTENGWRVHVTQAALGHARQVQEPDARRTEIGRGHVWLQGRYGCRRNRRGHSRPQSPPRRASHLRQRRRHLLSSVYYLAFGPLTSAMLQGCD